MWDLLDTLFESLDVYQKHGVKGCLLVIGLVVLIIGGVIAFVYLAQ